MHPDSWQSAFFQTSARVLRKLPVVILAAFACYGLYYLDAVKRNYDHATTRPINIDDDLVSRLKTVVENKPSGTKAWLEINPYLNQLHRPFSDADNLLAAWSSEIISSRDDAISKALEPEEVQYKQCCSTTLAKQQQAQRWHRQSAKNHAAAPSATPTESQFNDCYGKYSQNKTNLITKLTTQANKQKSQLYSFVKAEDLTLLRDQGVASSPKSAVEDLLLPTLDEKRGFHVIYQTLRITFVVILIFTLLTVIGLLLRTILNLDSATTLAEQTKGLISGGSSAPSLARAAVISVAAIGVGSAVAASVAISNAGPRRVSADQSFQYDETARAKHGPRWQDKVPVSQIDRTSPDDVFRESTPYVTYREVLLRPNVLLPQPQVTLDPKPFQDLQAYLVKQAKLLDDVTKKVDAISKPGTDISIANYSKPGTTAEVVPLKVDLNGLIAKDKNPSVVTSLDGLIAKLDINGLNARLDQLDNRPLNPEGRNVFGRMFGDDLYFVSSRSLDRLKQVIPSGGDNAVILGALEKLSKAKTAPMNEETLLGSVTKEIKLQPNGWNPVVKKSLSLWKGTILMYTRVP